MIDEYFQTLTTFPAYDFEPKAIAPILNHQDILLRAPTGSGKTQTAIAPFLFAKALNLDFPNKLIYVVRTAANSSEQSTPKSRNLDRTMVTSLSATPFPNLPDAIAKNTGS